MTPTNEMGLRECFAIKAEALGYEILKSQAAFPDYLLRAKGVEIKAEAELISGNFLAHKHDAAKCDLIVCWKHTRRVPVTVLEIASGRHYQPNELPFVERKAPLQEEIPGYLEEILKLLEELRNRRWSDAAIGKELGVSGVSVWRWRKGERNCVIPWPSRPQIQQMPYL